MRRMLDSGDSAGLQDAAHELAGSAANIGAVRVADLARQVETGGPPAAVHLLDRLGPSARADICVLTSPTSPTVCRGGNRARTGAQRTSSKPTSPISTCTSRRSHPLRLSAA
jgi:hypothetical protein